MKQFLLVLAVFFAMSAGAVRADNPAPVAPPSDSAAPAAPAVPGGAPSATAGQPGAPGGSPFMSLMPFLLVFGVMYFLMIRPQQKRMKEHKALLETIKKGDDVVTTSGFIGKVTGLTDKVVTLELSENARGVKVLKSQISQIVKGNINEVAS